MIIYKTDLLDLQNVDCMEAMKELKDKHFDLAIVDPPYGIDINMNAGRGRGKAKKYKQKNWDKTTPNAEYFNELRRVSKNQIVWGANHFIEQIPYNASCWIVWDKENGETTFADCELAWTSFPCSIKKYRHQWHGFLQKNKELRIHPTQKPVALYKWLLQKFANPGNLILDTHMGSGSIAIACHEMGFNLTAFELDEDYFEAALKRIKTETSQLPIFATTNQSKI